MIMIPEDNEILKSPTETNVLCRYAIASILLMIYMIAQGAIRWSAVYLTLATVLYGVNIKKRPLQNNGKLGLSLIGLVGVDLDLRPYNKDLIGEMENMGGVEKGLFAGSKEDFFDMAGSYTLRNKVEIISTTPASIVNTISVD